MAQEDVFKKLVSHCKEYGFVFPSSEIYDGLGAVYDYGQYGVELKNNIKKYWWDSMTLLHENVVGIDSAIFMHPTIWKASGHVDAFNDPLIDNKDSKKRYRADVLIEDHLAKIEEKINKEVAKAAKKFGDAFDEAQFRATNGRVLEYQAKWNEIHERYSKDMNDSNFEDLRQLIWSLKQATDNKKPISVKIAAVHNIAAIASGVARAGADIVVIDVREQGIDLGLLWDRTGRVAGKVPELGNRRDCRIDQTVCFFRPV